MEILIPSYEDEQYDMCGNVTMAIARQNGTRVALCKYCLDDLRESLKKYDETIFCYKCKNFIMSIDGWNYGGSCLKDLSPEERESFNKSLAGYNNCKDCLDTCDNAVAK